MANLANVANLANRNSCEKLQHYTTGSVLNACATPYIVRVPLRHRETIYCPMACVSIHTSQKTDIIPRPSKAKTPKVRANGQRRFSRATCQKTVPVFWMNHGIVARKSC